LFWKLFFSLWMSIMGFMVLMAVVNNLWVQSRVPEDAAARSHRDIQVLEERIGSALRGQGPQAARRVIRSLPRQVSRRVFLFDPEGQEISGRNEAHQRLQNREVQAVTREIRDARGRPYELMILRSAPRAVFEPGGRGVLLRLLLAAVISALVSFVIARYLAAPLARLGSASRRLAGGDLSTRIGPPLTARKDEFGALAADFDEMASRLQDLQSANRRLLRDVSHELRSPLARLRVALEIARNREAQSVRGELDRIELESERLETLVDEVLVLLRESSGTHPLRRERFDLGELLTDLREAVDYETQAGVSGVGLELRGPMPVLADRELLWRAFENLVRNALLHSAEHSGVEIEAGPVTSDGHLEVLIRDRGPGIPAHHLAHIFEPFYRVEEARDRHSGGHGLGLAIAFAAVRRHGGTITASNRESGGLEMRVELPPQMDEISPL
jgi:two-component system sensor histidine kinase CpxA